MPFEIANPTHVSKLIELTNKAAVATFALQDLLMDYATLDAVNGIGTKLGENGAAFPAGFTIPVLAVNDARFALGTLNNALTAALNAGVVTSLNGVRQAMGVVAGTG